MSDDKEIRIDIEDSDEKKKSDQPDTTSDPVSDNTPEPHDTVDEKNEVEKEEKKEEIEELSEEDKLRGQLATAEEKLLLTLADFENYKKRQARRQEEFYRTATDALLGRFLDVIDNFERALAHADETDSTDGLLDGAKMIHKQLNDILGHYQVTPIEALGQPFDPNLHEALMQIDSDEYDEGINAVEIAKGYKANDRVLRHSKVGVSKGAAKESPDESNETETDNDKKPE